MAKEAGPVRGPTHAPGVSELGNSIVFTRAAVGSVVE